MKESVHVVLFVLLLVGLALGAWQDGVDIKSHLRRDDLDILGQFDGQPEDHLLIVNLSPGNIFVGARDAIFNLSSSDLSQNSILNWTVSADHKEMCQIKGQKDSHCHNYLRMFHGPLHHHHHHKSTDPNATEHFMVCGTNAFKPICRIYDSKLNTFTDEFSGIGYTPFDPSHESTSVLHHGSVYAGTVADFGGTDALIYKAPLRTEQYDHKHLHSPSFVSSMSYGDLALFFFKEFAVEHSNCGKAVFSRIGRICRHDSGSRKHKDRFTTFLKARLNCSIPGEFPFYFDHIQGTTDLFTNSGVEMLYAVFTTPANSLGASAVCAFTMGDLLKVFEGPFKGQTTFQSNWLPVPAEDVPSPRPGSCSNDPNFSPDSNSVVFHKSHPIMDEAVQGTVVMTYTSNKSKFSAITVDISQDVSPYHIIYIGTDKGEVLKAIVNAVNATSNYLADLQSGQTLKQSFISQSWSVFEGNESIKTLRLISPRKLLVTTETQMVIIRVDNCEKFINCRQCIEIRDPHCAWNEGTNVCMAKDSEILNKDLDYKLIQDVSFGDTHLCTPDDKLSNEIPIEANHARSVNEISTGECCPCTTTPHPIPPVNKMGLRYRSFRNDPILQGKIRVSAESGSFVDSGIPVIEDNIPRGSQSSFVKLDEGVVNSQTLVIATLSSILLSLIAGFILGFMASKKLEARRADQNQNQPATNAKAALTESQRLTKSIDYVVNVDKNSLKRNNNTEETLQRTKKMYL